MNVKCTWPRPGSHVLRAAVRYATVSNASKTLPFGLGIVTTVEVVVKILPLFYLEK